MTKNREYDESNIKPGAQPEVQVKRKTPLEPSLRPSVPEHMDPHHLSQEDRELIQKNEAQAQIAVKAATEAFEAGQVQAQANQKSHADAKRKFQQFLDNRVDNILPNLPHDDPAWAYAWVPYEENVNKVDNFRTRLLAGWTPVKWGEIPGLDARALNARTAQVGEYICFNELVAVKIDRAFRDLYLEHYHHTLPNQMEGFVREDLQSKLGQTQFGELMRPGDQSDDFNRLGRDKKKAHFTGV